MIGDYGNQVSGSPENYKERSRHCASFAVTNWDGINWSAWEGSRARNSSFSQAGALIRNKVRKILDLIGIYKLHSFRVIEKLRSREHSIWYKS